MFCAPGLIFGGTASVVFRFHVWRARTYFRRYRGRRLPFSCIARPKSFSAMLRESCPVFIFYAPGLGFDGTEGIMSRFHFFRSRTSFRRYRGRRLSFSCFARPDSFSVVPRASCPVFMFCVPGLGFDGTEGVVSRFHVCTDSFSAIMMASAPAFMFCAPGLVFGGTEGVVSRFHVLRARTHFRRYRGRRPPSSCFARPNSISTLPRASCLVFKFYAPGLVFRGNEGVVSRFHVLRARTRFWRYRGRRVPFSSFACPDLFSTVQRASCLVFHVLHAQTRFRRYRGRWCPFSCFAHSE
jgi:hypothetical protein